MAYRLRNRLIVWGVYALLGSGTVYGYVRVGDLESTAADAAVVDSARIDSILNLTILVAALPGTVEIRIPVEVEVPYVTLVRVPDSIVTILGPERVVFRDSVRVDSFPVPGPLRVDTVRLPVPGPIMIETIEVPKANWKDRIFFGAGGIVIGYGIRALFWNEESTEFITIHDHHDHFVVDTVHHHHEHKDW